MTSAEYRNATRREPKGIVEVIDSMTGLRVGHLVDLSASGLQVATLAPLVQDALYQWRFPVPAKGAPAGDQVECGIHLLWVSQEPSGQFTAGGRFIQMSKETRQRIRDWCEAAS